MDDIKQTTVNIRLWSDADLPLLMRLMGDPLMTHYLGGPETPEKILARHERYVQAGATGIDPMFVVIVGTDQIAAGSIGYWAKNWQDEMVWETGWSILPEFQGRGIATKAAALIVDLVRLEKKYGSIHAFPSNENAPSNAICRKAGFVFCGEVSFEYPPGNIMRCNDWRIDL